MELLFSIPIFGSFFSFLVHDFEDFSFMLSRFYFMHILLLPSLFFLLLYISFSGIRRVGLSEIRGEERRPGRETFPAHLYNLIIIIVLIFGVLVTFAVLAPVPFEEPIDYFNTPGSLRMPWYLLAPYGMVEFLPNWLPLSIRSLVLLIILITFVLLPFLDRRKISNKIQRIGALSLNLFLFSIWLFFSFYGAFLDIGGS